MTKSQLAAIERQCELANCRCVPLTDEQIHTLWIVTPPDEDGNDYVPFARAVEAHIRAAAPAVPTDHASPREAGRGTVAEPRAWLVEWTIGSDIWVAAHASEVPAVDQARKNGGTCTPLYARPDPLLSKCVDALRSCVSVMERELAGLLVIQPELAQAHAALTAVDTQGKQS